MKREPAGRKNVSKKLATLTAVINGANTLAPMALLYVQPNLTAGGNQVMLGEQPVAAKVSASEDRKPYSCAQLQSLAYEAMSTVDNAVFAKAEAASYIVDGSTSSVDYMSTGDSMIVKNGGTGTVRDLFGGTQLIYGTAVGTAESIQSGGRQLVSGTAINTTIAKGGTQILYYGGTLSSNTLMGGVQIISSGGTLIADDPSASKLTTQAPVIFGGTQIVSNGGTASGFILLRESSIGGIQRVKSGGLALGTEVRSGAYQSVDSGGTALGGTLSSEGTLSLVSGSRIQLDNASGGYVDMNGGSIQYGKDGATTTKTYDTDIFVGNNAYAGSGTIVLGNGGWGRSYSAPGNVLNIVIVNGNYDFIVNTDVNKELSDRINVKMVTESSESRIGVNYDPVFDPKTYGNYFPDKPIIVATGPYNITFKPLTTETGAVRYIPWLRQNGMQWQLTGFSKRASTNTSTTGATHEVVNQIWYNFANSLSKRMGDLRLGKDDSTNGVWARYMRSTDRAGRGAKSELNSNLLQVGYDKAFTVKNGTSYVGIAVDHLNGSTVYDRGTGTAKGTSVALYNTWIGNTGHYYDIILRQGHFSNDYNVTDLSNNYSTGDYGTNATTLSGEYGYRKNIKNGMYLEPQAEIILGHLSSSDYITSSNWPVHINSQKHFITRLGVALGKANSRGNYYARASYFHDFGGAGSLSFDGYGYSNVALRDWVELTVGGDILISKRMRFYGEVTKYLGDLTNNVNFNAGLRWTF